MWASKSANPSVDIARFRKIRLLGKEHSGETSRSIGDDPKRLATGVKVGRKNRQLFLKRGFWCDDLLRAILPISMTVTVKRSKDILRMEQSSRLDSDERLAKCE